jgi:3-hydroxybutyryl-CoA dehydrogenase
MFSEDVNDNRNGGKRMSFKKVGVVGAGMMGAEIALCFAKANYDVFLADSTEDLAAKGKDKQAVVLDKSIKKGKFDAALRDKVLGNVTTTADLGLMKDCDFIVEAVFENLEVKQDIYRKLDAVVKPSCIIASNTSTYSITKLASAVSGERAPKFIGTHFNSPASVMKLVEVIPALLTDEETTQATIDILKAIDKEPVKVKDVVGFALNRIFHAITLESARLVEEGVCSVEDVDKVCIYGLGWPMGIFKLIDATSLDLNMAVDTILFEAYGDRYRPSPLTQRLVDAGRLGAKVGKGYYDYDKK